MCTNGLDSLLGWGFAGVSHAEVCHKGMDVFCENVFPAGEFTIFYTVYNVKQLLETISFVKSGYQSN